MRRSLLALLATCAVAAPAEAQFREEVTVARVLVDVRVTDYSGNVITDLEAADFEVRIGGAEATVEAADWIDDARIPPSSRGGEGRLSRNEDEKAAPHGRTVVVFVQTDFARNAVRTKGQMNFRRYAEEIIHSLGPDDRVAVFSFDSHLKFRSDLTTDKEAVIEAFRQTIRIDRPPPPPVVASPSLAEHLDPKAMREAASSEVGLRLVARALSHVEGPKILLLLGWGLGERFGGIVQMRRGWTLVRQALDAARVTIVSLDTTYADSHDLQVGLQHAAEETGGFYAKTHELPAIVVDRFLRTFAGRYEIALRIDGELRPGTKPLDVRVRRKRLQVLAPKTVVIQ